MSDPQKYTVGWICAITTEFVAAQAFFDEKHDNLKATADKDNNNYAMGKIGEHNVVVAVLPKSEYGTTSAATVARDMVRSFPNIRFGLMVGIGGGAPSGKHDIRLGDVVVSARCSGKGGVFQYDYGKAIQDHAFETTGSLNEPPQLLLTALSGLEAKYELEEHQLSESIEKVLEQRPRLRKKYSRPHPDTDRLYRSDIVHPGSDACGDVCSSDPACLVNRKKRGDGEDDPAIHYGLVASANQLMKDALARDKLAASMDVLCFEMEAAGLMNHFPCLVIRGICDYSDSHKNKQWQGFAAMMAAAYAKDLLCQVIPSRVEAERKVSDILSGLQEIAEEHRDISKEHCDIAKKQLQAQKDLAKEKLSEEQQKCHQLFRLTTRSKDATYEWYKDRVEERIEGTCMWLLEHNHFQAWLKQESGPLLVSADPGCGKSVLAKYLIDDRLPRSTTICYFFFKDQDQNTVRQALCALLHQLFSLKPFLIEHAMPQFRKDGQGLINSTESLWKILRNATKDPQAGPVIMVLDALDECAESEFTDLMRNIENQFRSDQSGHGKLKYLLTCRPYHQILSKFRDLLNVFPNIHIPGEEESETISQEVNLVIRRRIDQLAMKRRFTTEIKNHLEKRLQEATHRTYLWVYLVFDYLQKHDCKKTLKGIESAVATLPTSVNEAYEQILTKANKDPMILKVLSIILAASRPLTLSEMNVAVNVDDKSQSVDDLDLEDDEDFKARLRSWCGLFVSIHQGSIYFIHQTAREFLLADSASSKTLSSELRWHHSINITHAHAVLAKLCVLYLNFFNSNIGLLADMDGKVDYYADRHPFLDYSAKTWGAHFHKAEFIDDDSIIPFALRICDTGSKSYSVWFRIYWRASDRSPTDCFTDLMIAAYYGHRVVVKLLLDKDAEIEAKDRRYGQTPLSWAAKNGHEAVVKLLLDKGAEIEAKDSEYGRTPLSLAAENEHEAVVKLLLDNGADVNADGGEYGSALHAASYRGHKEVVALLLDKNAHINANGGEYGSALHAASYRGHKEVVALLLNSGADINADGGEGADIESKDGLGRTPLWLCATERNTAKKNETTDNAWASKYPAYEAVVTLLLASGADINSKDQNGQTLLLSTAKEGDLQHLEQLRKEGADMKVLLDTFKPEYITPTLSRVSVAGRWIYFRATDTLYPSN
ncbi:ankyrin repeat domain-containing protein [Fusarium denticulatum]|uniref:Ankyrin repeat domain-containing protein n=1 Tax=Fusarium denticulatum TaxID=48507 RepID=A0A8H5WHE2_9HYPO|nr:ankyrin repeat domain-containing protein [Fusarium denticulatum]